MSGNPYHSSDIGGFYGAAQPSPELYVRWLQATVFCSHIRVHGIGEREPWAFGAEVEAIARKWLAFRYRLIPYLESVIAARDARPGLPVMRAMPLALPGQRAACATTRRSSCAATRCSSRRSCARAARSRSRCRRARGTTSTRAQRLAGRAVLRYRAKLDQFPVFGREGHALPLGRAVQHTGEIDAARPLELLWVFGSRRRRSTDSRRRASSRRATARSRVRVAPGVKVEVFGDAAGVAVAAAVTRCCRRSPTLAITVGEPAGIGPELVRDARRAARARSRSPARLVVVGDRALLAERAARIGLAPRYADYDPVAFAPRRRRDRSLAPAARRAGHARPSRSDQRAQRAARCCDTRCRRLRDRRVRRARHRAGAEERDAGRRHPVHRATPSSSPSARTRRAS